MQLKCLFKTATELWRVIEVVTMGSNEQLQKQLCGFKVETGTVNFLGLMRYIPKQ